jgi:hypothetical protein
MKVYKAICVEDWHIEAENGDRQDCKRGKEYTVSKPWGDGTVTVFSGFWVHAPERIFAGFATLSGEPAQFDILHHSG